MVMALIARALEQRRRRMDEAFKEFCGEEPNQKCLEMRRPEELPRTEPARLPYKDNEFDWVACYELIETCGSHERQVRLLRELLRIAKRGIFVSTPNRWHPLSRWLRPERNVSLLDGVTIKTMVDVLPGSPVWKLDHIRLGGIKSHFALMVWKAAKPALSTSQTAKRPWQPNPPPHAPLPIQAPDFSTVRCC